MPTEGQNPARSHQGVPEGQLALKPPLKILGTTVGVALLVWGLLFVHLSSPAWAAQITVNTTADTLDTSDPAGGSSDGLCSLREAITAANTEAAVDECAAGTGEDTIVFDLGSSATITLDSMLGQLPTITDADGLTIDGGDAEITVSGDDKVRVFGVGSGAKLALENLTVSKGFVDPGNQAPNDKGGGAYNGGGTLTITNSTFSANSANYGGGVGGDGGTLNVTDSTFSVNRAAGGFGGGGIYSLGSTTTVTNSTFSGNSAGGDTDGTGGGIYNAPGSTLTVTNSTFSGNSAGNNGGAISQQGSAATVISSTFVANSAFFGDTIFRFSTQPPATFKNTILVNASATSGDNCTVFPAGQQPIIDGGYNIDVGTSCGLTDPTSKSSTDPLLDTNGLQENGGPTKTIALQDGSPAIDAIPSGTNGCGTDIATDQRGVERPQDGNGDTTSSCDIGAFEVQGLPNEAPTVAVDRGGACRPASDTRGSINLTLSDPDDPPENLILSATSSNQSVLPDGNISFGGGTDASRTLSVRALAGSGSSTLNVEVSDGDVDGQPLPIEVMVGTNSRDTLTGSDDTEMIFARRGNDTASGQGANDLLCGANGKDALLGAEGDDTMGGGNNDDSLTGGGGADIFRGGSGTDTATDFDPAQGDTQRAIP